MKNKQFRQSLIAVQQSASCDNYSSLLEAITRIRIEGTTRHYVRLAIVRGKSKRIKNDEKGRQSVYDAVEFAMERCYEKGFIVHTPAPEYTIDVKDVDTNNRCMGYTIIREGVC